MKKVSIAAGVIAFAVSIITISSCGQRGVVGDANVFTPIASTNAQPEFPNVLRLILSEDAKHYAICYELDGKYVVFSDGRKLGEYESIADFEFRSGTLCYAYSTGGKWNVRIGGREFRDYDEVGVVSVSPDGLGFSFEFRKGGQAYRNVSDTIFGPYDSANGFEWLGTGYLFNYESNASNFIRMGSSEFYQGEYPVIAEISENRSNYGFVYKTGENYRIRIGATNFGPYESAWGPAFDASGKRYGFYYRRGEDAYVYIDGVGSRGPFDMAGIPEFDASGSHYAYWFLKDGREYIDIDGKVYGGYQFASGAYFSADGKTFAFRFVQNNSYGINRNGTVLYTKPITTRFDSWSAGLKLSDDGSTVAFWYMQANREYLDINGSIVGGYDSLGRSEEWKNSLVFASTNYAYWYNDKGLDYIVVNGTSAGEGYDEAGWPYLSSDGSTKVFWYEKDNKEYIYVNGNVFGPYEAATFRVTEGGRIVMGAIQGGRFTLKEIR